MKKLIQDLKVVKNKKLNSDNHVIELFSSEKLPLIFPGQFVEVLVKNSMNTFLRRPFSIHDVDYDKQTLSLFIKKAGDGTKALSRLTKGETINVMYPLGKSFTIPPHGKVLLIGGGCGIAPLLYLAKSVHKAGVSSTILIGGRTKKDILLTNEYKKYGTVLITTEDGSMGEQGLITHHSVFKSGKVEFDKLFACGPEPMMKAIARYAKDKHIECEVSLENTMACGIGACLCCVVETVKGNQCVCTEGPVFNIKELTW